MENGLFIHFLSMIAICAANFCSVPVTGPGPAAANVSTRHTLTTGVPCILVWVIHTDASGGGGGRIVSWERVFAPVYSPSKRLFLLIFPVTGTFLTFISQFKQHCFRETYPNHLTTVSCFHLMLCNKQPRRQWLTTAHFLLMCVGWLGCGLAGVWLM